MIRLSLLYLAFAKVLEIINPIQITTTIEINNNMIDPPLVSIGVVEAKHLADLAPC